MDRRTTSAWTARVTRATWPFGHLRATAEQVSVAAPMLGEFVVTRANVASIVRFDFVPLLGRGLRFEVRDSGDAVVFWTYRRERIILALASLGWPVEKRRP